MTPTDRHLYASGMEAGARVCEASHEEALAEAAERATWRALLVILGLALGAAWFGDSSR